MPVTVPVHDLNTDWYNRCSARIKTAAFGLEGGICVLPFEEWFCKKTDNMVPIPEETRAPMKEARILACDLIQDAGTITVERMIELLTKRS